MKIEDDRYYHIYNRGNNKGLIFFEERNYQYFLKKFKHYVVPHAEIFAYCLMPNHFHFFLKIRNKEKFRAGIKNFFISYSKSINQAYSRVGSLFQGRYKAKQLYTELGFCRIVTYIHENPVQSKLTETPAEYKFSSYCHFLSSTQTFISRGEVLSWFTDLNGFRSAHSEVVGFQKKS